MRILFQKIARSPGSKPTFVRFATVGVTISLIDAGLLYLLLALGSNVYLGRLISYTVAMTVGYILNRYFTFHHLESGRALWHRLLRHYSVHGLGGALNFAVFALVLALGEMMGGRIAASATLPLVGVWIGGMAGLCFNFFFSRRLVFDR
ncbi:MAG: GtrA family protein [Puniceicoccaceae bacterium]